jgi:hypothetical protein
MAFGMAAKLGRCELFGLKRAHRTYWGRDILFWNQWGTDGGNRRIWAALRYVF